MESQQQEVNCEFRIMNWFVHGDIYTCVIRNQLILEDTDLQFVGNHLDSKSNLDVLAVYFLKCNITKVPQKLTQKFPNLNALDIKFSNLKDIERYDLKEYAKLKNLEFRSNEIEYLECDLLKDMKDLEVIDFSFNKIHAIEPGLLDELNKLKYVGFAGNPCIDMLFDSRRNSNTLEEIKQKIHDQFSTPSWTSIFERLNNIMMENRQLKLKSANGILSDLLPIIQTNDFKDFTIKVDGEDFKVHKFLLTARSPVFAEMIRNNIDAEELNLVDISTGIFREILNFIYTDELPKSDNINFTHLLFAADKLKIEKLKNFAVNKLVENVNAENAFEMIDLSNKLDINKLRQKSFEQIKKIIGNESIDEDLAKQTDILKKVIELTEEKNKLEANIRKMLGKN